MTTGFLQDGLFSSENATKPVRRSEAALHGQNIERRVGERVKRSAGREVWWNNESRDFPRSFASLAQIYWKTSARSLMLNALVASSVHV